MSYKLDEEEGLVVGRCEDPWWEKQRSPEEIFR